MWPVILELPDSVEGNGPTLATLVEIGQILENAQYEPPLSLAEIGRRMRAKRVRHSTIRASVDFLTRIGFTTTGKQGVEWTYAADPRTRAAARDARPLA